MATIKLGRPIVARLTNQGPAAKITKHLILIRPRQKRGHRA
jgi:hypothetical protein